MQSKAKQSKASKATQSKTKQINLKQSKAKLSNAKQRGEPLAALRRPHGNGCARSETLRDQERTLLHTGTRSKSGTLACPAWVLQEVAAR